MCWLPKSISRHVSISICRLHVSFFTHYWGLVVLQDGQRHQRWPVGLASLTNTGAHLLIISPGIICTMAFVRFFLLSHPGLGLQFPMPSILQGVTVAVETRARLGLQVSGTDVQPTESCVVISPLYTILAILQLHCKWDAKSNKTLKLQRFTY